MIYPKPQTCYYILLQQKMGKQIACLPVISQQIDVLAGELLKKDDDDLTDNNLHHQQPQHQHQHPPLLSLRNLNPETPIELQCRPEDVASLTEEEFLLLLPIAACSERLKVFKKRLAEGLALKVGDKVTLTVSRQEVTTGRLRFKGRTEEQPGTLFGVELNSPIGIPDTNSRKYFATEKPGTAVFVPLNKIKKDDLPLQIGDRVVWITDDRPEKATVRWIGTLDNKPGMTVGVEFDNPCGSGTGMYNGQRLFKAQKEHASLLPVDGLIKESVFFGQADPDEIPLSTALSTSPFHHQPHKPYIPEHRVPEPNDDVYERTFINSPVAEQAVTLKPYIPEHRDATATTTSRRMRGPQQCSPSSSSSSSTSSSSSATTNNYNRRRLPRSSRPPPSPLRRRHQQQHQEEEREGEEEEKKEEEERGGGGVSRLGGAGGGATVVLGHQGPSPHLLLSHHPGGSHAQATLPAHHNLHPPAAQQQQAPPPLPSRASRLPPLGWSPGTLSTYPFGHAPNVVTESEAGNYAHQEGGTSNSHAFPVDVGGGGGGGNDTNAGDGGGGVGGPNFSHTLPGHAYTTPTHPGHAHPTNTYPGHAHPTNTYPGHAHPTNTYPGHAHPTNTYPGHAYPGHADSGHAHPVQAPPATSVPVPTATVSPFKEHRVIDHTLGVDSMVEIPYKNQLMYGVIRWIGDDEKLGKIVGVEMDEEAAHCSNGYFQNVKRFDCPPRKGFFIGLHKCKRDRRFEDKKIQVSMRFGGQPTPDVQEIVLPPYKFEPDKMCGKNKGIQGHHNSCYLDVMLFSVFYFTSVLDNIFYRHKTDQDIEEYDTVRQALAEGIVYPLRKSHYVRADKVMKLRSLLDKAGNMPGMMDEEKDPEELLNCLFGDVMKAEPLLQLSSSQQTYSYQLFIERDEKLELPTIQQLFEMSFLESSIKLSKVPSCLILQMPRFGKDYKMYKKIVPSLYLDVTDVLEKGPRECVICGNIATRECKECYKVHGEGLNTIAFCDECNELNHMRGRREHHRTKLEQHEAFLKHTTNQKGVTIPRERMELFAVICIETSHYVSFVKNSNEGGEPKWVFYDSMADREGCSEGYNIPEVRHCPNLQRWVTEYSEDYVDPEQPELQRRLFSDSYMCLYQNTDVMMFK
ncbi:hypothetical protein Ahia01_000542800 [Argonauta hians]